jgi:hypothetical protein
MWARESYIIYHSTIYAPRTDLKYENVGNWRRLTVRSTQTSVSRSASTDVAEKYDKISNSAIKPAIKSTYQAQ